MSGMRLEDNEAKEQVIRAGIRLAELGLIARTWGNVSCRINQKQFAITPSGKAYDSLTPDDIVICNIKDLRYKGKIKPSSEKGVHAAVYAESQDIGFVIHTHQAMASAVSVLQPNKTGFTRPTAPINARQGVKWRMPVWPQDAEVLGGGVPIAGYGLPGSKKLVARVTDALWARQGSRAIIMAHHGALCFGKDAEEAFDAACVLEDACMRYIGVLDFGEEEASSWDDDDAEGQLPEYIQDAIFAARPDVKYILYTEVPEIRTLSEHSKRIKPLIDDFAQIVGTEVNIIKLSKTNDDVKNVLEALNKNNAILIRNKGALCCASSESDAAAVEMILKKGAIVQAAAEKFGKAKPISMTHCKIMRFVYLNRYSKLE